MRAVITLSVALPEFQFTMTTESSMGLQSIVQTKRGIGVGLMPDLIDVLLTLRTFVESIRQIQNDPAFFPDVAVSVNDSIRHNDQARGVATGDEFHPVVEGL